MSSSMQDDQVGLTEIGSGSNNHIEHLDSQGDITSWREKISISIAKSRKIRGGNYVQIATVDPDTLEPRCRTVVFRGFLKEHGKETDIMKMITDKRSCKYSEVTASARDVGEGRKSNCELLWWFAKSSEQYRIRGQLKFVGADDSSLSLARKEQWGNLSDPAREQFFWKNPGIPYEDQGDIPEGGRDSEGKVLPPPDNFLLMILYPVRCDYLRLGDNYRQFDSIDGESQVWSSQRVTP